jgi:hypothetical protein
MIFSPERTIMELISVAIGFAAGIAVGFAGYRYSLKRNPEKLEAWAKSIKAARESAAKRF